MTTKGSPPDRSALEKIADWAKAEPGIGVAADGTLTVTGDRPLANLSLWSIRSVISIEPDVEIDLAPGATLDWKLNYTYYVRK